MALDLFFDAAHRGDADAMRVLLSESGDPVGMLVDSSNDRQRTPLMEAVLYDRRDAVTFLLDYPSTDEVLGAMLGIDGPGPSALALAVQYLDDDDEMTLMLLNHPRVKTTGIADDLLVHADDEYGFTVLMIAAESGKLGTMQTLLNHPAARSEAMLAAIDILDQTVFEIVIANIDLANEDPEAEDRYKNMSFLLRHVGMQLTRHQLDRVMEWITGQIEVQDDDDRDECVRLLLELGASHPRGPFMERLVKELIRDRARLSREVEELRRAPHLIDAVVGLAHRYGQQRRSGQAS